MMPAEQKIEDLKPNGLSLLEAALFYASHGMKVFPLEVNSKFPRKKWSWSRGATNDPELVQIYWEQWPNSNIGLATGAANGITVMDLDTKNGADGVKSYQALSQEAFTGLVQATPTGGGRHLLFTYEPGLRNVTHKGDFSGIDIRNENAYIVVSPSVVPEGLYRWIQLGTTPSMPEQVKLACQKWSVGVGAVDYDQPEVAEELPDVETIGLKQRYLDYLVDGSFHHWTNSNDGRPDESAAVFACAGALMRRLNDKGLVYGLMLDNPFAWACAARHTTHSPEKWLWKYGVAKAAEVNKDKIETNFDADTFFTKIDDPLNLESPTYNPFDLEDEKLGTVSADSGAEKTKGPFFISAKEGLKTQLQPTQWLIKGVLEKGQVGFLYGPSTVGKTFAALDMALHVSGGLAWHKHKIKNPGPVLYINGEGGGGIWRRINTWFAGYNDQHKADRGFKPVSAESMKHDMLLANTTVDLMNVNSLEPINEWAKSTQLRPALIVIDTLSTNMTGNENDSGDIARALKGCIGMAKTWGTTVLIVHHTNKAGELRGSGAIFNNSDFVLHMENVEGAKVETSRLSVTKSKDGEPAIPIFFELTKHYMIDVEDDEGAPMSSMYLKRVSRRNSGVDVKTQVRVSKTEAEVLGLAIEHIQDSCMLDPTATLQANSEELWPVYLAYCREMYGEDKVPKRWQFNAMLMSLTKKGHLHAVDEPGGPWYEMNKSDKKE